MSTITLKTTSKKKLDLIEALAKELGITVQKDTDKMPNTTTIKAIKEAKTGKTTKVSLDNFRKQLYA
ncbi:MAG TPA: hypothetical protein PLJ42_06370 [Chitinophagales bacterium]|jgi:hypothetical protein|nr:hypothetical protein [Chitinophagales bacterium]HQV78568.1 hypothetical protein [Chitinophagales bacterium]HQW79046.1 hypothetical protein [Chitinophagales bacterium]HRB19863.1 hypothetical protein [Chitinophagales bacterium]HRB67423.1 hypothetical protein [Chitinophagales bacterium]